MTAADRPISRGQLVEIGGGFRIPDVMRQSGAHLVEVGTTNRTYLRDYAEAITDRTAAILRVHTSNFRVVGFTEEAPLASTAVVMPVFNEDVSRVFEGLRVVFRSVQETKRLEHFDFFVLSDSNQPTQWIQEEVAWLELCKQVGGFGKIFYRKRRHSINKKAGNIGDFLRRWGRRYRYMIVLDADSIMTGRALVQLVALMERNPQVGIIQTAPRIVNGETLFARVQSFASRLYSPLFLAGLNYWQQHEGNFWGHNAVIRVQPFIDQIGRAHV